MGKQRGSAVRAEFPSTGFNKMLMLLLVVGVGIAYRCRTSPSLETAVSFPCIQCAGRAMPSCGHTYRACFSWVRSLKMRSALGQAAQNRGSGITPVNTEFAEAIEGLKRGDFTRLDPLFHDLQPDGGPCRIVEWCERGGSIPNGQPWPRPSPVPVSTAAWRWPGSCSTVGLTLQPAWGPG
jgi:hypothetical protein